MNAFLITVQTELLKLRRTLALWVMVLVPVAIAILQIFILFRTPGSPEVSGWDILISNGLGFWIVLALPLFVTLETALLGGLEHGPKMWKHVFALPITRWMVYVAKALVTLLLVVGATGVLLIALVGIGVGLRLLGLPAGIQWQQGDSTVTNTALATGLVCVLSVLMIAIHTYISLRWASVSLSLGIGMVATVTSFLAVNVDEAARLFPWVLPFNAFDVYRGEWLDLSGPLLLSVIGGALVIVLGAWDMTRQDVV